MKTKIYTAAGTKTIQEKITKGSQSLNFTGIYKINRDGAQRKVRVLIKRDSLNSQSYAKIQVWDGNNGWNFVTSLDISTSEFQHINAYDDDVTKGTTIDALGIDTEELMLIAEEIIF